MAPNIVIRQLGPIVSAVQGLRNAIYQPPKTTISGISENLWPNPLQPITPIQPPGAEPLGFQFNWGQNINYIPRGDLKYTAAQLRILATYPLARICIDNNKDILSKMPRKVQLKVRPGETSKQHAERSKGDSNLKKLNDFIDRPNWEQNWSEFIRPILDDMLVIDAASVFIGRDKKDTVQELRWIEGSSITRLIDEHGWTPRPPNPAYQQLWQGYPRVDLTTRQLVYRPRNIVPRNTPESYLYGMSPTESSAEEIEIGWQRLRFVLNFYTSGSIPGGILFAPVDTDPKKIKEAQQFIDSDLAGNLAQRRRLVIYQGFQQDGKAEQLHFPKEPVLADLFDEIHIRKICFAYGVSPQRLMRMMNRASAQTAQEAAEEEGTLPWLDWLKGLIDHIIQIQMGYTDYEVAFDPFLELDRLKQAMADAEDIKVGLYTRNEKRKDRGDDPRPEPEADELNVLTGSGVVPLDFVPPKVTPGATTSSGSSTPKGGKQPKTTARVNATQKSNGYAHWATCELHQESYPRTFCHACVEAELNRLEKVAQEREHISI